jgi:hypothetical protein
MRLPAVLSAVLFFGALLSATPALAGVREERAAQRLKDDEKITRMVVFEAAPGMETVGSMKPSWCDLTTEYANVVMGSRLASKLENGKEKGWQPGVLAEAATILCAHPDAPDWHKQTGYVVQEWINMTGLGKDDAIASLRARVDKAKWEKQKKETCEEFGVSAEASEEQKRFNSALTDTFGCRFDLYWRRATPQIGDMLEWFIDKQAEVPSELMRSYYVLNCLGDGHDLKKKELNILAAYARCGVDARALDRAKLDKELAESSYNDYAKHIAREQFANAKKVGERYRRVIDKLIKDDPEYKRIFFDVPEKAFKDWEAEYASNKKAIDAANAFETKLYGPSLKAMKGCAKELRANFLAHLKSKKPKTVKDAEKAATDRVGMVLLGNLMACEAAEGNANTMKMLDELYGKGRLARGPRYAAYYAVIDVVSEIRSDRTKFPLEPKFFGYKTVQSFSSRANKVCADVSPTDKKARRRGRGGKSCKSTVGNDAKGVVKAVKKGKDGTTVRFKTERWREEVVECVDTNKIWMIESNGQVKYFQTCTHKGWETVKHTEKTTIIPKEAAAGIKPRMFFEGSADYPYETKGYKRFGYPRFVYKSKKKKKLISFYGYKL